MSFQSSRPGPPLLIARLMMASVFIVMGGYRLWQALHGVPTSNTTLGFSLAELVLGIAIAAPVYWMFTQLLAINLPGLTTTGWI